MGELDYAGTKLVAVRQFENGVQVMLLSDQGPGNRMSLHSQAATSIIDAVMKELQQ